jgi:hypothetical protein
MKVPWMCCLLGSMVACVLVPCTSQEHSRDMVHYNCLDSLTAGRKQSTSFCMIARICHDLYQGVLGWFCCLASELGLAHSGAVHPANSPMAWPWCQCHSQATAPCPTGAHFTPSTNRHGHGHPCMGDHWRRGRVPRRSYGKLQHGVPSAMIVVRSFGAYN